MWPFKQKQTEKKKINTHICVDCIHCKFSYPASTFICQTTVKWGDVNPVTGDRPLLSMATCESLRKASPITCIHYIKE